MGVAESAYGFAELVGDTAGVEALKDIGEEGITRARARIHDQATFITELDEIDGVGSAFEWLGNNIALSLPYMTITTGAAVAAPLTGGLSLTAPAAVYTGQTWNEMEGEKNAAVAVGAGVVQAVLDRLGLAGIVGTGAPKEVLKKAVGELTKQGVAKDVAERQVLQLTKLEMAKLAGDAAKIAKQQIQSNKIGMDLLKRGLVSGSSEGVTEALQEATAYIAATHGSDKEYDPAELIERAQKAAITGGIIGQSLSIPGTLYDAGAWADIAVRQAPADAKRLSTAGRYAEEEIKADGRVKSIQEITEENRNKPDSINTLDTRIQAHNQAKSNRSVADTLTDTALSAPSLWQGATRWIFRPEILEKSRTARQLADMFGGQLQRTFSGSNFENMKHHTVSLYRNMVDTPETVWANLIGKDRKLSNVEGKRKASKEFYDVARAAINDDGSIDFSKIPDGPKKQYYVRLIQQLNALGDRMWVDQKKYNPELGYINNYLLRHKTFDKRAIDKNENEFVELLMSEYGIDRADAKSLAHEIVNNAEVNDIDEAFSVTKGIPRPGSHKKRSLNLSENSKFEAFMEQDLFSNISNAAKSASRYQAYEQFVGKDGSHIAKMLDQIESEGVPPEIVNKMAKQIKDYLDAESGNYKRPTSVTGKKLEKLQRNFMMFTAMAGLPLATLSSFVELALTMKGLTLDQILGKNGKGGIKAIAEEAGKGMWKASGNTTDFFTRKYTDRNNQLSPGRQMLQELGFYAWDVGAATTTGATEISPRHQQFVDFYFRAIGLQQWTDYTRAIRASIAGDYIWDKVETVANSNEYKTNEVQEAEEGLRNLGINVQDAVAFATNPNPTEAESVAMMEAMREASFNFVNEAVALPQSGNRPLIYQDPRFAVFTQFQGFVSTFTANHIPKLWGEYVKRGTPAMKYNAFAVMATMIALGFLSQYLKDLIKFGGDSPYLDNAEYLQRGVRSSGLLGTGERVLDQFFPIYEKSSSDAGEWLWNSTTGEAPSAATAERLGRAGGKLISGDVSGGVEQLAKATPFIGPFSGLNKWIGDQFTGWNFKE